MKRENMGFDVKMLAYCGLYCEQCSARVAFLEQNAKHLEYFPAKYKVERPTLSNYDCEGCKGRNICGPCTIKSCASTKNIESCAECNSFPCATLEAFGSDGVPHHGQAIKNLQHIRLSGNEAWFENIGPTLRCHCGERQSWYYVCPLHGE